MQLAILSDIHDNVWNLNRALEASAGCDALLCCGDLCSPFIVNLMAEGFGGPIHIVFGNNDGDRFHMAEIAANYEGRVKLHGEFADLPAEEFGIRIAVNHYPDIAASIAASGQYGLVCYGHDHRLFHRIKKGGTSILNPGTVMGYDARAGQDVAATFVTLDTETMEGYILEIGRKNEMAMWPIGGTEDSKEATE